MSATRAAVAGLMGSARALPGDAARHAEQLAAWGRTRLVADPPRALLAALRRRRPVLRLGPLTLLTRADDVVSVLTDDDRHRVTPYASVMLDLVGPFALAADGEAHARLRARLDELLVAAAADLRGWAEPAAVRLLAEARAARVDDPVAELAVRLPTLFVLERGLVPPDVDDPDGDRLATWACDLYLACFGNLGGDRGVARRGRTAAEELRSRGLDPDRIGLVVGAVPTIAEALPKAVAGLRERPERWERVIAAAAAADDAALWAHAREALRFSPQAPGLVRAPADEPDRLVLASTLSAMHDPARLSCPAAFRTDRPDDVYLHFGVGPHRCAGEHVARALLTAGLRAVALADTPTET